MDRGIFYLSDNNQEMFAQILVAIANLREEVKCDFNGLKSEIVGVKSEIVGVREEMRQGFEKTFSG